MPLLAVACEPEMCVFLKKKPKLRHIYADISQGDVEMFDFVYEMT